MSHSNTELLKHILDEIRFVLHSTNAKTRDELIENELPSLNDFIEELLTEKK